MKTRTERFCFVTHVNKSNSIILISSLGGVAAQAFHHEFNTMFWVWLVADMLMLLAIGHALLKWPSHCDDFKNITRYPYQWIWKSSKSA